MSRMAQIPAVHLILHLLVYILNNNSTFKPKWNIFPFLPFLLLQILPHVIQTFLPLFVYHLFYLVLKIVYQSGKLGGIPFVIKQK